MPQPSLSPPSGPGGKAVQQSFGSEDRLWKVLFDGEEFRKWREGTYVLHVFLDSLDECLLRVDNVATLIADQLPKEPVQRLRIRIACRTAPWPYILENALIEAFGPDGFEAYEFVPLRRRYVKEAAVQSIVQPDRFIQRIEALDVVSLAIKPVTLNFLIKTYLRDGDLPKNQLDLYERGCRMLHVEQISNHGGSGPFLVFSALVLKRQLLHLRLQYTDSGCLGFVGNSTRVARARKLTCAFGRYRIPFQIA